MREVKNLDSWIAEITADDSWRAVAEKLHTTHSTIQRRLKNHESDAIIEMATAYNVNPVSGLIAAGSISDVDVRAYAATFTVDDLSDLDLAQIIVERLEAKEQEDSNDPTPDVRDLSYVADDTDTEPEMGDEGYHDGP